MCENRKFDRELKDKVVIIVSSLVKNHKAVQDLLHQKGRLSNELEKVVRSTLKTFQGLTMEGLICGTGPQNGKILSFCLSLPLPGKDKQKDKIPFKKPSDDKKGVPRTSMV